MGGGRSASREAFFFTNAAAGRKWHRGKQAGRRVKHQNHIWVTLLGTIVNPYGGRGTTGRPIR